MADNKSVVIKRVLSVGSTVQVIWFHIRLT